MSKYSIEESTLTGIADAVRDLRHENDPLTPAEIEAKIRESELGLNLDICVGEDEPWVRPSDWPNLDEIEMDDDFDGVYLTYDLRKIFGYGWIGVSCETELRPSDAIYIERGHLENNVFVVDESHYVAHNTSFRQSLDEENGLVQLWRVRSDNHIQTFNFRSSSGTNANSKHCHLQPCVEATGKLPYITRIVTDSLSQISTYTAYVTLWMERDSRACGGKGVCTNLSQAWYNATRLRSLDVSKWDTKNWKVTTLGSMFNSCTSLMYLDLSSWDTSNWVVNSLGSMFAGCRNLRKVNMSNWDTSNWAVTALGSMFHTCNSLKEIDISNWDTSNWAVTSISSMFGYCWSLTSIDLNKWDTSNWAVKNMSDLFRECRSVIRLDISNWDTSNWAVTTLSHTFESLESLKELNVGSWDTSNWAVTTLDAAFSVCRNLKSINLNTWNTTNWVVTTLTSLFSSCWSLKEIHIGDWDTSNWVVNNINSMCASCLNLEYFDFNNWDTSNWAVSSAQSVFNSAHSLKEVDLTNWDTHNWPLNTMRSFFDTARSLRSIDISGWDTSNFNLANNAFGYVFNNLIGIRSIKGFETWDLSILSSTTMVSSSNLETLSGLPITFSHSYNDCIRLTRESLIDILTTLPVVTGSQKITLGVVNKLKLTPEEIAIATDKGWTVA